MPLLAQPREAAAQNTPSINLCQIVLPTQPVDSSSEALETESVSSQDKDAAEADSDIVPATEESNTDPTIDNQQATGNNKSEPSKITIEGYSEDDLFCLAAVIWQEAGSLECSDQLQFMVASVVMNHVDNPYLPNTIREVLERDGAYGTMGWMGIDIPVAQNDWEAEAIDRCYTNAKRVLEGERWVPSTVIYQAGFVQGSGIYDCVEGVYFCYE